MAVGWYVGSAVGRVVGSRVGEDVGSGDGCMEKGLGVNLFGNGGEGSTFGDSVGCVSGKIGTPLDGLGVFGAFEGFVVDGFEVGGLFLEGMNVGRLLTGLGVGFLLFGLFVGSCVHLWAKGARVGQEIGEAGTEGARIDERVGSAGVSVIFTLGRCVCSTVGWYVRIGFFFSCASFVSMIAATIARNRNQRGAACFMVLDCGCDVDFCCANCVWRKFVRE